MLQNLGLSAYQIAVSVKAVGRVTVEDDLRFRADQHRLSVFRRLRGQVAAENLRAAAEDMEDSAWRMGIERDSPLGIWVVTMRRSLTQLADITEKLSGGVTNTIRNGKALIEAEVERLRTVRETATIQLHEATAALTKAQVEAEKLTLKTLNDLIPKIVDQIRDAVVIREKRYN